MIGRHKSGLTAEELFLRGDGISYEDFNILDSAYTDIRFEDITLETDLGKGVKLNIPIIAAPMDTVTNADLSIALALEGGIAVIHYNHKKLDGSPDIDAQVNEIVKVKRFQSGFIADPVTVSPEITIKEAKEKGQKFSVMLSRSVIGSGIIDSFPVTEDGTIHSKLVGFINRTCYFEDTQVDQKVGDRMFTLEEMSRRGMVLYGIDASEDEVRRQLNKMKLRHLIILDDEGRVKYLVTRKDIEKRTRFPKATHDPKGRLRVLFAAGTRDYVERIRKGFAAGADGVVVDTSQGNTAYAKQTIQWIKENYPDKLIIGGNISTGASVQSLYTFGMDAYRCGQGSGSICTTQSTIGSGRTGASSVYDCGKTSKTIAEQTGLPVLTTIADGGIRTAGDAVKALAVGAEVVMLGNLLAGTDESPGEVKINAHGEKIVEYWGMGSEKALSKDLRDYGIQLQGVSGYVSYKGSVHKVIQGLINSVKKGMHVFNCKTIKELHEKTYSGELMFELRRPGSIIEGGVHSLKR